jgi:hypothetical protein
MKKPFTLYKGPTKKKNRYIYYVQFRDYEGNRLTAVSSGQTSKSAAEVWAYEKLKEGSIKSLKDPKFSVFAQNWFVWGRKMPIPQKTPQQRRLCTFIRGLSESYTKKPHPTLFRKP